MLTRPKPEVSVPIEYLVDPTKCSQAILGEYQLLHLGKAANLDREIRDLVRLYIAEMAAAGFAIFMREHRNELLKLLSSK